MIPPAWQYAKGLYRGRLKQVAALWAGSFLMLAFPLANIWLIKYGANALVQEQDTRKLLTACAVIAAIRWLQGALTWVLSMENAATNQVASQRLRDDLVNNSLRLSSAYYAQADRAKIHTHMVVDVERLQTMAGTLLGSLVPAIASAATLGIMMAWLEWRLTALLVCAAPLYYLSARYFNSRQAVLIQQFYDAFDRSARQFRDFIDSMVLIKIHGAELAAQSRQMTNARELVDIVTRRRKLSASQILTENAVTVLVGLGMLLLGNGLVTAGDVTVGGLFAFLAGAALLREPVRTLLGAIPAIMEGNRSLHRLYDWLQTQDEPPYTGRRPLTSFQGRIELRGMRHLYGECEVLKGVDLILEPGLITTLSGLNGAGKTTLANLILGLYRPTSGQILVDGIDLNDIDIQDYRRQLGVVQQVPLILTGTVAQNIACGEEEPLEDDLWEAIRLAGAGGLVTRLGGVSAFVGESGGQLSGGEKQRLAIARAFYRNPRVLILDEPSNHLDTGAVEQLILALKSLPQAPAIFLISHQPLLLNMAARCYHLENGVATLSRGLEPLGKAASLAARDHLGISTF